MEWNHLGLPNGIKLSTNNDLHQLYKNAGNSIPNFLELIFDFLLENHSSTLLDKNNISIEHLIHQCYNRSLFKYQKKDTGSDLIPKLDTDCHLKINSEEEVPFVSHEVEICSKKLSNFSNIKLPENIQKNEESIKFEVKSSFDKIELPTSENNADLYKKLSKFDSTNGAICKNYVWAQTIEDLDVRLSVPMNIQKGRQVKVNIQSKEINIEMLSNGKWEHIFSGTFLHSIKQEDSMWSLHPGHHLMINLEKCEECFWNKLLTEEESIDLQKITSERDFSSLPDTDQAKIQEIMWNRQQQQLGKPTSDAKKMEDMLKKAWDVEGSPFQGQPFDPSSINFSTKFPSSAS